jgi:SnoaL-like domain
MKNETLHDLERPNVIPGIELPIIYDYFRALNASFYRDAAELFVEDGLLKPPFEKQVQGRDAIAQYLETEAKGMKFCPESGGAIKIDGEQDIYAQYQVQGKVQTNWFTVNVGWLIQLASVREILAVEVKLLAELKDLLHLKRG